MGVVGGTGHVVVWTPVEVGVLAATVDPDSWAIDCVKESEVEGYNVTGTRRDALDEA